MKLHKVTSLTILLRKDQINVRRTPKSTRFTYISTAIRKDDMTARHTSNPPQYTIHYNRFHAIMTAYRYKYSFPRQVRYPDNPRGVPSLPSRSPLDSMAGCHDAANYCNGHHHTFLSPMRPGSAPISNTQLVHFSSMYWSNLSIKRFRPRKIWCNSRLR